METTISIFPSTLIGTVLTLLTLSIWIFLFFVWKKEIKQNVSLRLKKNLSVIMFCVLLLFFFFPEEESIIDYITGIIIAVVNIFIFFRVREKEYENLRQETLFDEKGNFLLKGKEIRFPL